MQASVGRAHIFLGALLLLATLCDAHGYMTNPVPRGGLAGDKAGKINPIDPDAPRDYKLHFPSANKNSNPGSAARTQKSYYGGNQWAPFAPEKPGFVWRSGVCGDPKYQQPPEHGRGGKYYNNAKIVKTYVKGQTIEVGPYYMIAHHNGFFEMRICDVAKCGGEISEACFKQGHCRDLKRAANPMCDGGQSKECGPIDTAYPSRWHLPCLKGSPGNSELMAENGSMRYELPADLQCEHCVLHFYWATGNKCNPPGVADYFKGPDGPKNWGNCPGQAGAKGGLSAQSLCGDRFAEEYYSCFDVAITGSASGSTDEKSESTYYQSGYSSGSYNDNDPCLLD